MTPTEFKALIDHVLEINKIFNQFPNAKLIGNAIHLNEATILYPMHGRYTQ